MSWNSCNLNVAYRLQLKVTHPTWDFKYIHNSRHIHKAIFLATFESKQSKLFISFNFHIADEFLLYIAESWYDGVWYIFIRNHSNGMIVFMMFWHSDRRHSEFDSQVDKWNLYMEFVLKFMLLSIILMFSCWIYIYFQIENYFQLRLQFALK